MNKYNIKKCPKCLSNNVLFFLDAQLKKCYVCLNCEYTGIEKEFKVKKLMEKRLK